MARIHDVKNSICAFLNNNDNFISEKRLRSDCNTIGGTLPQNDRVSSEIHEDIILKHIVVFSIVVLEAY